MKRRPYTCLLEVVEYKLYNLANSYLTERRSGNLVGDAKEILRP